MITPAEAKNKARIDAELRRAIIYADIPPEARIIWLYLRDRQGTNPTAYPSVSCICRDLKMARRSAIRWLGYCERAGIITVTRASGTSNEYHVHEPDKVLTGAKLALVPERARDRCQNEHGTGAKLAPITLSLNVVNERSHSDACASADTSRSKKAPSKGKAKAASDPRVAEFITWFADEFKRQIGRKYIVQGAKDGATVKRLLTSLDVEQLKAATAGMFADSWARDKADIGLLGAKINSWLAGPRREGSAQQQRRAEKLAGEYASPIEVPML